MTNIRILIADDDPIIREGLAVILNHQDGLEVVAVAENGVQAINATATNGVDVALIDVDMPVLDGIKAAEILADKYPDITVIMLTAFTHQESLAQSLAANVRGFLTKDLLPNQLAVLIKQAFQGLTVMSPGPSQILAQTYLKTQHPDQDYKEFRQKVDNLPNYLHEVFNELIQAKPNKTIAKQLHLSDTTVRSYISEIFQATGFTNRGELTIAALKAGY